MRISHFAALAAAALTLSAPAHAEWQVANSKHFTVYADESPADIQKFAEKLERFDAAVRQARGVPDVKAGASARVSVYVVRDLAAVREIYGDRNAAVGGFYVPKASGSVAFVPEKGERGKWGLDGQNIFFHEYTHHLMFEDTDRPLPTWVSEGFAEFFASPKFNDDGSVTIGAPPLYRAETLYDNFGLPIDKMLSGDYLYITGPQFESIYGRGWLLTHLLAFDMSRRGQLTQYLDAIQRGVPALKAAQDAFGDLKALDRELTQYFKKDVFTVSTIPASQLHIPPVKVRSLTPGEVDTMQVRVRLARGGKQAHGQSGRARSAAAKYPDDAEVQTLLSKAELVDGDAEDAKAAGDRAVQLNPRSYEAQVAEGTAMLELAKKNAPKADWDAVRAPLLAANKLDPEAAQPLRLFYETYVDAGVAPTKNALDGLAYALVLAPQDNQLRMELVGELINENKLDQAKDALKTIAYSPHQGKWHDAALAIFEQLNAHNQSLAKDKFLAAQKYFDDN
jgi:hypothetical protein